MAIILTLSHGLRQDVSRASNEAVPVWQCGVHSSRDLFTCYSELHMDSGLALTQACTHT